MGGSSARARYGNAIAFLAVLGCSGEIQQRRLLDDSVAAGGAPNGVAGTGGGDGSSAGSDAPQDPFAPPTGAQERAFPSAGLRRLTASEYRATLQDLLGVEVLVGDAAGSDTALHGFASIGATRVAYSAQQVEQLEQSAYDAAQAVFDDAAQRAVLVGCEPASVADTCVRDFLARFARRAFRRPASPEEIDAYAALVSSVATDSDVWSALAYAVAAMLQSPSFLYRVELGEPEVAGSGSDFRRLTSFEVATRLSYLVTGSTPDETLLSAAESGLLDDTQGLRAQLERLLGSSDAEATLMRFFEEQLEIHHVSKMVKAESAFPAFTPALAEAMQRQMHDVVRDVALRQPADLLSLFTRRDTYVDGALAELYGLPAPGDAAAWMPVTLPADGPRAGLLGLAGFLASHAAPAETSATKRGFFVVSKLLCRTVPPPPPTVVTTLPEPAPGEQITMRERVERHMKEDTCRGCHVQMDPFGLALEHFDALGVFRETDDGLAIDARGELDGRAFDGALELGVVLAEHPEVAACFARRFYEFALGTQAAKDEPVPELAAAFERAGRRFPELVRALVAHEVFRSVSEPR